MKSTSETGHAKNVANFEQLVSFCTGYGTVYNPSKAGIKLTALNTLLTSAKNSIAAVNTAMAAHRSAAAARDVAFVPLSKLATRILNALIATDTSDQVDETARSLVRKLQGHRASAKLTDEEKKALAAQGNEHKEISSSQMSFDSRLDTFDKLIKLLTGITLYAPNEADLKVTALTAVYTDLKTKNTAVITAATTLSNARISRNDMLYKALTGLVDIALDTKTYIKSLFGGSSAQYGQVKGIEFKNHG